ncbi:hypothetical protein CW304_28865 [Bacillus sp. UFRGS-B20]|nr:hypothetical protein CW304_28865 [Bacillus sp. UFRGS-B20]
MCAYCAPYCGSRPQVPVIIMSLPASNIPATSSFCHAVNHKTRLSTSNTRYTYKVRILFSKPDVRWIIFHIGHRQVYHHLSLPHL